MRITIEIPKEFEEHFNNDRFEDTLHRLSADAHLIAGNYEQETAAMLIHAFKDSQEVKHGKWEIYVVSPYEGTDVRCSECGQRGCVTYWDFCPNCGADMRGNTE